MTLSDWRGITRLATQATHGVTRIVEGVHQNVWSTLGFPGGKSQGETRGITRMVYQTINGTTKVVGQSADTVLAGLEAVLDSADETGPESPGRKAFLSALNGVIGDHLSDDDNPFAIPMSFSFQGQELSLQAPVQVHNQNHNQSGKVMLLIHGLCMNDLEQQARHNEYELEHGQVLAEKLGYNPVYLRYNSGLHVSQNGRELAARLEQLLERWPTEIEELSIVGHSMGGLLIRSALHYATQQGLRWPEQLENIVFLGTPHQGAPLERIGNWLDLILVTIRHARPFSTLGKVRSAGVTDLRFGNILEEDWHGQDRFHLNPDNRAFTPLPKTVNCYCVAATLASRRNALADHLVGDGLVPLRSALGQHKDTRRSLDFAENSQFIVYNTNHMDLLNSPEVANQIVDWLTPEQAER